MLSRRQEAQTTVRGASALTHKLRRPRYYLSCPSRWPFLLNARLFNRTIGHYDGNRGRKLKSLSGTASLRFGTERPSHDILSRMTGLCCPHLQMPRSFVWSPVPSARWNDFSSLVRDGATKPSMQTLSSYKYHLLTASPTPKCLE